MPRNNSTHTKDIARAIQAATGMTYLQALQLVRLHGTDLDLRTTSAATTILARAAAAPPPKTAEPTEQIQFMDQHLGTHPAAEIDQLARIIETLELDVYDDIHDIADHFGTSRANQVSDDDAEQQITLASQAGSDVINSGPRACAALLIGFHSPKPALDALLEDADWADEDGELPLPGGAWGNPGCECGQHDAVLKLRGKFWCQPILNTVGITAPTPE